MTVEFRNALNIGSRVDHYEIEAIIGHGGFGISYRAVDTRTGQRTALKEYLPTELATREPDDSVYPLSESHIDDFQWGLERFLDEVQLLSRFRHPNIVRVAGAFQANGTAYMVMGYEDGESLAARLKREQTLDSETLVAITMPLLDGLELVHQAGFIHRDIKPSNIYLRLDGSPVLLDFGSARQALKGKSRTLTALVSAGYAPLEQYFARRDLQGPWTDIYGFGATLYHTISGEPPIDAVERSRGVLGSTRDILPPVAEVALGTFPPCLLAAVDHALRIDDQERPRSIGQWRRELTGEIPVPRAPVTTLAAPDSGISKTRQQQPLAHQRVIRWRDIGVIATTMATSILALGWWHWSSIDADLASRVVGAPSAQAETQSSAQIATLRKSLEDASSAARTYRRQVEQLTSKLSEQESALRNPGSEDSASSSETEANGERRREQDPLVDELKAALEAAKSEGEHARQKVDELSARLQMLEALQSPDTGKESLRAQEIAPLLAAADGDITQLRLTTPAGNNAHERYLRVLELDRDNAAALLGLERIVEKYIELARRARNENRLDTAESYLDRAAEVLPTHDALATAREKLEQVRRGQRRQAANALKPQATATPSLASNGGSEGSQTSVLARQHDQSDNRQERIAKRLPKKDSVARVETGTTSKISIAVFPGAPSNPPTGRARSLSERVGELSTETIARNGAFRLHYSFYADFTENETRIPEALEIWTGFGPDWPLDEAKLLMLGRRHALDAVLIFKVELGPPWGTWGGGFSREHVSCRIFDMETSTYLSKRGTLDDAVQVVGRCLTGFQIERAKRQSPRITETENQLAPIAGTESDAAALAPPDRKIAQSGSGASDSADARSRGSRSNSRESTAPIPARNIVNVDARRAGGFGAMDGTVDARSLELVEAHVFVEPGTVTLIAAGQVNLHPSETRRQNVGPDGITWPRSSRCHMPLEEKSVDTKGYTALGAVMESSGALFGAFAPQSVVNSPRFRALNDDFPSGGISSSSLFLVGRGRDYSADQPGTLFLGVNDCNPGNNSGSFSVEISAAR